MAEQVFLPTGEVWSMGNEGTQCTVGREAGQRAEKNLCLNLSCLAIKYEFYFT